MTGRWDWLGWYPEVAGAYSRRQGPPAQGVVCTEWSHHHHRQRHFFSPLSCSRARPSDNKAELSSLVETRPSQGIKLTTPVSRQDSHLTPHSTPPTPAPSSHAHTDNWHPNNCQLFAAQLHLNQDQRADCILAGFGGSDWFFLTIYHPQLQLRAGKECGMKSFTRNVSLISSLEN